MDEWRMSEWRDGTNVELRNTGVGTVKVSSKDCGETKVLKRLFCL